MTTPPTPERLVARLLADAEPVRPLWSPDTRLAIWLLFEALMLGFAVKCGLRQDLGDHLHHPPFVLELGMLVTGGALAARLALRAAVPGLTIGGREMTWPLLLLSAAVLLMSLDTTTTAGSTARFIASGAQCFGCIVGFAAMPWIALWVALRRGAPLDGGVAGTYAGAAAFLFAAAAIRIACPIDSGAHLLTWHGLPIAVGAALSAVAGASWLERWSEP